MAFGHDFTNIAIAYCCCLPNHSIKIKIKISAYSCLVKGVCFIISDGFDNNELENISEI